MSDDDLRRKWDNQKANLTALQALLAESDRQRALLSDLLDRERDKLADALRRLDRIADVVTAIRARSARPSLASSTKLMKP